MPEDEVANLDEASAWAYHMTSDLEKDSLRRAPAVAEGAWFGPIRWPVVRRTYVVDRDRTRCDHKEARRDEKA
jgi:hypothetical protein